MYKYTYKYICLHIHMCVEYNLSPNLTNIKMRTCVSNFEVFHPIK